MLEFVLYDLHLLPLKPTPTGGSSSPPPEYAQCPEIRHLHSHPCYFDREHSRKSKRERLCERGEKEGKRERGKEGKREREKERKREREKESKREREKERKREREKESKREREKERKSEREKQRQQGNRTKTGRERESEKRHRGKEEQGFAVPRKQTRAAA